jgi:regulator of protease activity HflC (stomatin/prohibitin superfamily)
MIPATAAVVALVTLVGGGVLLSSLSNLMVVGGPDEWVLQIRDGQCVRAGIGASVLRRPGDVVVRFSATVQRVRFQATVIDADLLELAVEGFALWSVNPEDPFLAFRRLGLVDLHAGLPSGQAAKHLLVRAQHRAFQQAFAALARKHAGRWRYVDLTRDPASLLAAIHTEATSQLAGLGVLVEEVQLLSIQPTDSAVLSNLAAPSQQVIAREAERARTETQRELDRLRTEAKQQRQAAEIAAELTLQAEQATLAAAREEAADQALQSELDRQRRRVEADIENTRLRIAVEEGKSDALRSDELARLQTEALAKAIGGLPIKDIRLMSLAEPFALIERLMGGAGA